MSEAISAMQAARRPFKDYHAHHFRFEASEDGRVATVRLDRPERKNPLTFDSYAELRNLFVGELPDGPLAEHRDEPVKTRLAGLIPSHHGFPDEGTGFGRLVTVEVSDASAELFLR